MIYKYEKSKKTNSYKLFNFCEYIFWKSFRINEAKLSTKIKYIQLRIKIIKYIVIIIW